MEIKCNSCLHSCVCGMKQTYIETANSMDKLLDEGSNFGVNLFVASIRRRQHHYTPLVSAPIVILLFVTLFQGIND